MLPDITSRLALMAQRSKKFWRWGICTSALLIPGFVYGLFLLISTPEAKYPLPIDIPENILRHIPVSPPPDNTTFAQTVESLVKSPSNRPSNRNEVVEAIHEHKFHRVRNTLERHHVDHITGVAYLMGQLALASNTELSQSYWEKVILDSKNLLQQKPERAENETFQQILSALETKAYGEPLSSVAKKAKPLPTSVSIEEIEAERDKKAKNILLWVFIAFISITLLLILPSYILRKRVKILENLIEINRKRLSSSGEPVPGETVSMKTHVDQ